MKRLVTLIIMLAFMLCAAALADTSGDFTYTVFADGTVRITGYSGEASSLTIPGELDGKTVTGIGRNVFVNCFSVTSVTLPDSVTSIETGAFENCMNLERIMISLSSPLWGTLQEEYGGSYTVTVPVYVSGDYTYTVLADGTACITKYNGEDESVYIPAELDDVTVTEIGYEAFCGNTELGDVKIPDGVAVIGDNVFDA